MIFRLDFDELELQLESAQRLRNELKKSFNEISGEIYKLNCISELFPELTLKLKDQIESESHDDSVAFCEFVLQ